MAMGAPAPMWPWIRPQASRGADIVIVLAMHADDDPAVLAWLRAQAARGAVIVGVCSGALGLGRAACLMAAGSPGTGATAACLLWRRHPTATYVPDRRYLADGYVVRRRG
jgi:transcriptional regulator GlxA family with amidase domain